MRKYKLEDRISWLQEARDSAAAHGKRRRLKPFTQYEAMEAQHLADTVLNRALWSTADSLGRGGKDCEIGFLLDAMFFSGPGWSMDPTQFNGKSAVELVRTSGGLAKVFKNRGRGVRESGGREIA